jgi:hypothetical protein
MISRRVRGFEKKPSAINCSIVGPGPVPFALGADFFLPPLASLSAGAALFLPFFRRAGGDCAPDSSSVIEAAPKDPLQDLQLNLLRLELVEKVREFCKVLLHFIEVLDHGKASGKAPANWPQMLYNISATVCFTRLVFPLENCP